ncbi:Retrovirus-related Pol polyprotein from transposon 412 [Labeo rohita]|uniref:ribonuclease H n=1 Tax=Labeo rohita TaxID=84645 RepID=A0A498N622_LABRO|nr:Retrovirus-related Pol polyprotein from transposon 412 [Labeo rohita]
MQKLRGNSNSKQPLTQIKLYGDTVPALIDSGAAVNIISEKTYNKLSTQPRLLHTDLKILAYGSKDALPILGKFTGCVEAKNKTKTDGTFYVIKGDGCSLLRYQTADELGLIKIIRTIRPPSVNLTVADELVNSHPELFDGIGKLKDFQVTLHINPDIQPTCQPHRRVPFHVREKVEAELQTRSRGHHRESDRPNTLGLAHRNATKAQRSRQAAEVFQNTLQGIAGVKNLSDDIIVYGATQADHDKSLTAVFQQLKERGLTLNRKKCEFNKTQLEFFGFIFSAGGVSADPKKVDAIYHAKKPKDAAEVRSLLGIANYCSRFIPNFATVTEPLRKLTRKNTTWQ